jgi:tetratricopeptide (TPR) repeat protein
METSPTRNLVRAYLPWLIGAAMLLLYLITLEKTISGLNLMPLARAAGADWRPALTAPLTWLVTFPIRWLPAGSQLIGLNLISAISATLSLVLLARCVMLLPHDRTALQRDKAIDENGFLRIRLAWVPVVFAMLVCGLQWSFWEHAIAGTGEALDLLLFAYCIRCLFEYRVEEKNSWLYKLALVYGIGITNNVAMIGFFPALLVALVWIKGLRFFRFDFLSRMFLFGLAGLSLYLLLPLVQLASDDSVSFWVALKTNLMYQKQVITFLPRWKIGWIAVYSLLPLAFAAFRWTGSFGDPSAIGSAFSNLFAQLLHAGLLVFCLYMAFDPPVAPREFASGLVLLPAYFLGALAIGYYTGFLLVTFSPPVERARRRAGLPLSVTRTVHAVVCLGALLVVAGLVFQNYRRIHDPARRSVNDYTRTLVQSLPDKPSVILSDEPARLQAVRTLLGRDSVQKHILVSTEFLPNPAYHRFLKRLYGERWPAFDKGSTGYDAKRLNQLLTDLAQRYELIYLHPSFGHYFEAFYQEPLGLAYKLKARPADSRVADLPPPGDAVIAAQTAFWDSLRAGPLRPLKARIAELPTNAERRKRYDATFVGEWYSRAMDVWGVELQRAGKFEEAYPFFTEAIALNPDNAAAMINREANAIWRKEKKRVGELSKEIVNRLNLYPGDVRVVMAACGPIDEPAFAIETARVFVQQGLYRQAAQFVHRALFYSPDDIMYQSALANLAVLAQQPDDALSQIRSLRARAGWADATPAVQIEVARVEALAHYVKEDFAAAEKILQNQIKQFPEIGGGYNALWHLHFTHYEKLKGTNEPLALAHLTNALRVVENQVAVQPQNPAAWFDHGNLCMFRGDWDRAIESFTKVLELQKDSPAALLNRAISSLQSKKLDAARKDYNELLKRYTSTNFKVYYGLADIAYQKKEWRAARDYYKEYLRYAPPELPEVKTVRERYAEAKKKA